MKTSMLQLEHSGAQTAFVCPSEGGGGASTHSLHSLLCTSSFASKSPAASAARCWPCRPHVGAACAASAVRLSQCVSGGCGPCQPGTVTASIKPCRVGSSRKLSRTTCRKERQPGDKGMVLLPCNHTDNACLGNQTFCTRPSSCRCCNSATGAGLHASPDLNV